MNEKEALDAASLAASCNQLEKAMNAFDFAKADRLYLLIDGEVHRRHNLELYDSVEKTLYAYRRLLVSYHGSILKKLSIGKIVGVLYKLEWEHPDELINDYMEVGDVRPSELDPYIIEQLNVNTYGSIGGTGITYLGDSVITLYWLNNDKTALHQIQVDVHNRTHVNKERYRGRSLGYYA